MLLSDNKKFIFLKTVKTAGTSLEFALAAQLGGDAIITPQTGEDYPDQSFARVTWVKPRKFLREIAKAIYEKRSMRLVIDILKDIKGGRGPVRNIGLANEFDHISAQEIAELIGEEKFNNYLKVSVCRNPYDEIVSLYFWRMYQRRKSIPPYPELTFDEWLISSPKSMFENSVIMSRNGDLAVDLVIRYENLAEGVADLCKKLDINYEKVNQIMSERRYKSEQRPRGVEGDRKTLIGPESKAAIDFFMDWEFKTFGYEKIL